MWWLLKNRNRYKLDKGDIKVRELEDYVKNFNNINPIEEIKLIEGANEDR